jgi:hypothetical protein
MMTYKKTSELLLELSENLSSLSISLNSLLSKFGDSSLALCVLILALPNIVPLGIPIISSASGLLIMIVAVQMVLGKTVLSLPVAIGNRQISSSTIKKMITLSLPTLRLIERFTKPRSYNPLIFNEKLIGVAILILAFVLFLPIPFINFILAFCICALSIGLLERDEILILTAIVISAVILVVNYKLILLGINLIKQYL